MKTQTWKTFEKECTDFLTKSFGQKFNCTFELYGGSSAHTADIYVRKYNKVLFCIEVKMPQAQCGQFVVFPNELTCSFIYSKRNEFTENIFCKNILQQMEDNYYLYNTPSNNPIIIDKKYLYDWVKNHYLKQRNSKYMISKGDDYVIFNINKIEKYFDIEAVYRTKKSGSANPNSKDIEDIINIMEAGNLLYSSYEFNGKYFYVYFKDNYGKKITQTGGKYTYLYKQIDGNKYRITKLSNTFNANVIFTIKLKREQDYQDLEEFINEINNY